MYHLACMAYRRGSLCVRKPAATKLQCSEASFCPQSIQGIDRGCSASRNQTRDDGDRGHTEHGQRIAQCVVWLHSVKCRGQYLTHQHGQRHADGNPDYSHQEAVTQYHPYDLQALRTYSHAHTDFDGTIIHMISEHSIEPRCYENNCEQSEKSR